MCGALEGGKGGAYFTVLNRATAASDSELGASVFGTARWGLANASKTELN